MARNQVESKNPLKFVENGALILSDKKGVQTLVFAAKKFGVRHVIISPGSRNAPLTISFKRSGWFTCHSMPDERAAGFYGLGMALRLREPVILICTSGSAAANYLPAITEAFFNRVPLMAVTADRPLSWTDQGNGQTIRQEKLFSNHIRHEFSLISEPKNAEEDWQNRRLISESFNTAICLNPGPVHINVPLFEPLYNTEEVSEKNENMRFYRSELFSNPIASAAVSDLARLVSEKEKVMVLVGQHHHDRELLEILAKWSELPNLVTLTETTGNINIPGSIDTIDRIIMPLEKTGAISNYLPDVLITIGGYVISKKLKNLIRSHKPQEHWHIHLYDTGLDTYMSLTREINANPVVFLEKTLETINPKKSSSYSSDWKMMEKFAEEAHRKYLKTCPFSDFKAFELIDRFLIDQNLTLHLSNSTPIRYIQLYGLRENITYHCNRGTSGIDGCTSTALGWAKASENEKVLLISGDMSFVYDSNAFWNRSLPENFKAVVINNNGGGIFRIIQGASTIEEREEYFEAHHKVDLEHLTGAYGLDYFYLNSAENSEHVLAEFWKSIGPAVLEIKTPTEQNDQLLMEYFNFIAEHFEKVRATAQS